MCLILLNYFLLCWWIYRNQFTKYHDCWLCIYLFGFAPSSLCVLLAYYSSCSCQGSKGGNINPSWGEPHVFGNTSAIWHWSVEEKWLNNNTDVQIAPKHVTCMHACTYNCEMSSSMYLSPMCIETGEIDFYNSCFLKLHEFRLFYILGWLLFMLINQLPIYPVLAVYQCFFVSMISSAPSPKTMSFNAIGAKDSLEKKRLAKVLMPPLRGNKWAAKRGFVDDDCRGLAMFETSICGVERKVSPCLSQWETSNLRCIGLAYFISMLSYFGWVVGKL